jgi:hypothetical protein
VITRILQHGTHVFQLAIDTCPGNGESAARIGMRTILFAAQQRILRNGRREPAAKMTVHREETDFDSHLQQGMQRRGGERYISRNHYLRDFDERDFYRVFIRILDNQVTIAFLHNGLLLV